MDTIQKESRKISKIKRKRHSHVGMRSFACGGCMKTYKTYAALYLHVQRKHNGIMPPGTITLKSLEAEDAPRNQTGRPFKVCF